MRIFLVGFMASGKTSLGKKIAKNLNLDFLDLDSVIEDFVKKSIPDFFKEDGEDSFRIHEKSALNIVCEVNNVVIATGGGTPCYFDNMKKITYSGIAVYIKLPPKLLTDRLQKNKSSRPLISSNNNFLETLHKVEELLQAREKFYCQSQIIIPSIGLSDKDISNFITAYLLNSY